MRVLLQRRDGIDKAQLPCHAKMHDQLKRVSQAEDDVLATPPDGLDRYSGHRIDELLRLRVANDFWKVQLGAEDGSPHEMRTKVRDDGLDFRELRHYLNCADQTHPVRNARLARARDRQTQGDDDQAAVRRGRQTEPAVAAD